MRMTGQRRQREFERLDIALSPARDLIMSAVEQMVGHARRAPGDRPPDVPASVIAELNQAVAITAAMGLRRSACSKVIQDEFLIRLVLKLEDLEANGVSELMTHTRASLDAAWVQMQQ
jgi:hypothetical protein